MHKLIQIHCENNFTAKEYPLGTNLFEVIEDQKIKLQYPILGARVNNEIEELHYEIFKPKTIQFIDATNPDGWRMYVRSLCFLLMKAVRDTLPEARLHIDHSISRGYYCEIENLSSPPDNETVFKIGDRMRELTGLDLPFVRREVPTAEALSIFEQNQFYEKHKLFARSGEIYTSIYYLDTFADYFYGYLVPSTGYLHTFDLIKYRDGMLLMLPKRDKPDEVEDIVLQDKLFDVFQEHKDWAKIIGAATIGEINQAVEDKKHVELIHLCEALHEKKTAQIADQIKCRQSVRVVLISGPSSSGKTTFSKRLAVQLRVAGLKPIQISLDNYFVDREHTPRDEKGEYDFEAFEAIDSVLFQQNFNDLLAGKEVNVPTFNFQSGRRLYTEEKLKIGATDIVIVEGIHALNPRLTAHIAPAHKFRVYVSALTQTSMDNHNRIPTTDNRLLRRIVRDHRYRGYSALETLRRWPSVRRGEARHIFPYQEEADIMFNSALIYELGVLKTFAVPLLKQVPQNQAEYSEAMRLLKFLSYFKGIKKKKIPPTSILREFLDGSSFHY